MSLQLDVIGVSREDAAMLAAGTGIEPELSVLGGSRIRAASELVSAAFVLGVLNVTPLLIKAIADLLLQVREKRYLKIKLTSDDGQIVVEGLATPEKIGEISEILKLSLKPTP